MPLHLNRSLTVGNRRARVCRLPPCEPCRAEIVRLCGLEQPLVCKGFPDDKSWAEIRCYSGDFDLRISLLVFILTHCAQKQRIEPYGFRTAQVWLPEAHFVRVSPTLPFGFCGFLSAPLTNHSVKSIQLLIGSPHHDCGCRDLGGCSEPLPCDFDLYQPFQHTKCSPRI